jgi:hypothetical protein
MKHFTIENETNNITIHGTAKEADAVPDSQRFSNEAALAKLAAEWPASRLVEIWNSLPGEAPVKKFKNRATAVSRIWKAIQNLAEVETGTQVEEPQPEPVAEIAAEPEMAPIAPEPVAEPAETPERIEVAPEAPALMFQPYKEAATATSQPEPEVNADAPAMPVAPQPPHVGPEAASTGKRPAGRRKRPRSPKTPHPVLKARPAR